jgi:hypothetical protein
MYSDLYTKVQQEVKLDDILLKNERVYMWENAKRRLNDKGDNVQWI